MSITEESHGQPEVIVTEILRLTEELSKFSSFEPNARLDETLAKISHICHKTETSSATEDQILNDARIVSTLPKLRDLWGRAAGELEDSWANRILGCSKSDEAVALLNSYPRLGNYKATIPIELGIISIALGKFPSAIAMLGSGPLPLTTLSIVDAAADKNVDARILNIDIVPERIQTSEKICSLLGGKYKDISHHTSDAGGALPDLTAYDAVYVASLVGNTDADKIEILKNTASFMRPGAVIVVRSSSGLSRLLWPALQSSHFKLLEKVLKPTLAAQPLDGPTKHSVLILKVL